MPSDLLPAVTRRAAALWLVLALALGAARGDTLDGWREGDPINDYLVANGRLSDDDFYRMVACAAPPGRDCRAPVVRWPKRKATEITVSLWQLHRPHSADRASRAIDAAIAELNRSGARIALRRVGNSSKADIRLHFLDLPERTPMRGTGIADLDGRMIDAAVAWTWWNGWRQITRAEIVFSRGIAPGDYASVALEEITQSLGLAYDIGGRYYDSRSIFAKDNNSRKKLGDQDVMALRRHYPNG